MEWSRLLGLLEIRTPVAAEFPGPRRVYFESKHDSIDPQGERVLARLLAQRIPVPAQGIHRRHSKDTRTL